MLRVARDSLLITVNNRHSSLASFSQFDVHGGLFIQEWSYFAQQSRRQRSPSWTTLTRRTSAGLRVTSPVLTLSDALSLCFHHPSGMCTTSPYQTVTEPTTFPRRGTGGSSLSSAINMRQSGRLSSRCEPMLPRR